MKDNEPTHSFLKTYLCAFLVLVSQRAVAEDGYLLGKLMDVTSTSSGLHVRLENGVPGNCDGAIYGWMLVPEANKAMIALALLTYQNGGSVTVYTSFSSGTCVIHQFDPA